MKTDGRSLDHRLLEGFRFAAVGLRERGVPVADIAGSFGVTSEAVYTWLKKARTKGVASLRSTKAPGPEPALSRRRFDELISILRRPASEAGYATDLWSGPRVRHVVKHRFGVAYHPKHMSRFLRRLGLVLKFPERRALEQDPEELRCWKEERLPEIVRNAKKRRALAFYADECLISLIPYVGKTWTFPEARPVARVSGRRGVHVGVTAAVNAAGRMCFEMTREGERFTAATFLRFVRKMRREYPRRGIVLIVDGASGPTSASPPTALASSIHTAKIVKTFEVLNASWLAIEILPAYSPELSPAEKSWNFVKTRDMNGSTATDLGQLESAAKQAMRRMKRNPRRVASFFVPPN
jgi:transposase